MTEISYGHDLDVPVEGDLEILARMRQTIQEGNSWYLALLDAVALWTSSAETYRGDTYRYLIANEAFDWLRLAERLCSDALDLIPRAELERLLFRGLPPIGLPEEEFRRRLGAAKYRAHLNFFYGVTVEQALVIAVEDEMRKEAGMMMRSAREYGDPYERIYGLPLHDLLENFHTEQDPPALSIPDLSLDEMQAFTYWLFKFRVATSDPARVASDTKKGLNNLQQARRFLPIPQPAPPEPVPAAV